MVPGGDSNIIVDTSVVELCKPPVNEPQCFSLWIDHDILRFHISVDDPHRMRVVQGNEELREVVLDIGHGELVVQDSEVNVVDAFEYQCWDLQVLVPDNVQETHHVGATCEILQDLHLSVDFLHLHRFQDLDYTRLVVDHIHAFKHLGVFAPSDLGDNLIVLGVAPLNRVGLVVPVVS